MTIARRRAPVLAAITARLPAAPEMPAWLPGLPGASRDVPAPESMAPVDRLRRCTYRRVDILEPLPGRELMTTYEAMCLVRGRTAAVPLGDIDNARLVCAACTATGIFRPDEA